MTIPYMYTYRALIQRARTINSLAARYLETEPIKDPSIQRELREARDILDSVLKRGEEE
jgi:hypothetical protein